jgi:hypothetical protein
MGVQEVLSGIFSLLTISKEEKPVGGGVGIMANSNDYNNYKQTIIQDSTTGDNLTLNQPLNQPIITSNLPGKTLIWDEMLGVNPNKMDWNKFKFWLEGLLAAVELEEGDAIPRKYFDAIKEKFAEIEGPTPGLMKRELDAKEKARQDAWMKTVEMQEKFNMAIAKAMK